MRTTATPAAAPGFSLDEASTLTAEHYGFRAHARALPSERDQNFLLTTADGANFVLKISATGEDRSLIEAQHEILARLAAHDIGFAFPCVQRALNGQQLLEVDGHLMRLVTYLPGEPLATVSPHTPALLQQVGQLFGLVDRVLAKYQHSAVQRELYWDLRHAARVIRDNMRYVSDTTRRSLVDAVLAQLQSNTALLASLRESVIHNDGNDYNLIVRAPDIADPFEPPRLIGLIDFGDVVRSWTLGEVAIAATYAMLGKQDPLTAAADVVAGYHAAYPIPEQELPALLTLLRARLAQSVTIAAAQRSARPDNEYLSISEAPAWAALEQLHTVNDEYAHHRFRLACGLEPSPRRTRVVEWIQANTPAPLIADFDMAKARVFDFSGSSLEFGELAGSADPVAWTRATFDVLQRENTPVGLGRYDEARPWYTAPAFDSPSDRGPDWRTIHIGVDVFATPNTAICAPFDGIVHSFRNNAGHLDYGPTIILQHDPAPDVRFFTLYGHLSLESLEGLQEGQRVSAGQPIAGIGDYYVNGGWSPHLHFQIIVDLYGRSGEFAGVARPSERALWLSNCPDPNLVLRAPQLAPAPRIDRAELLRKRKEQIGPNLSIAYRTPLVIVRGWKQYLYDDRGQPYLDCVNNVAHVGHSHPRVNEALRTQQAVLNTNTRYLHPNIERYAERLTATLPAPLRVCYFVNSGSEANELALRLARAHTRARDVIVIDGAYHGNTSALIDLSPYKFDGPGGSGRPDYVQVVPLPDPYRGLYRGEDSGQSYARHVTEAIESIRQRGERVAAFFAEPLLGCGGQIVPPAGYLAKAFELVRAAGGVCIADEVQTGLGRAGTHFWAFETQGVTPDIVTVGKPIGNGHPLGAVITTPDIAASFNNGMEYFNTFGGNPVACAVGLAVLDVIEEEGLQQNALTVGQHLLDSLAQLNSPLVGDVRGSGLYLGVELVLDPDTRRPAGEAASYVANRLRELGILLSTDGPDHNVLKIKPPLVFTRDDADRLADTLDQVLREGALRR